MSKRPVEIELLETNDLASKRARVDITDLLGDGAGETSVSEPTNFGSGGSIIENNAGVRADLTGAKGHTDNNGHNLDSQVADNVVYLVMQRHTKVDDTEDDVMGVYNSLKKANRVAIRDFMQYADAYEIRDRQWRRDGTIECSFSEMDHDDLELKWWVERREIEQDAAEDPDDDDLEANFENLFDGEQVNDEEADDEDAGDEE